MNLSAKIFILSLLLTTGWSQYPSDWVVDAHDFEHNMTLTGRLIINDIIQTDAGSAIAAFHDNECRGVIEGTQVGEDILYFLVLYANTQADSLEFRAWDAAVGNVVSLNETTEFYSGVALGNIEIPYLLSGTNSVSFIEAFNDSFEQIEDEIENLPFDILSNDTYDRSLAMAVSFPNAPVHGILFENLDQTFTYLSDLNFFGLDSFQYRVSHAYGADSAWAQINVTPIDDPLGDFHLIYPPDASLFEYGSNSNQNFSWGTPGDDDGDPISYTLYVFNDGAMDTSFISTDTTLEVNIEDLQRDSWLDWFVIAYDGWGWTASTDTFSIQVSSLVYIIPRPQFPETFLMHQNFPNPFNPITNIDYGLAELGDVSVTIYDITGQIVRQTELLGQSAGWYTFTWNGTGESGQSVSSGLYLCQIQSRSESEVVKMLLLK
ncbi:MAG: T9SS type A sorting domain-containing protein [Candidatus Marinimicrobia bacterium]|nr:T9SS type A sorting domain-containing protein [Candidatus Neomarinimicrobiota bacterium]